MISKPYFIIVKNLILSSLTLGLLYGCASNTGTHVVREFNSPKEVIAKKGLNSANNRAREYVYDWGATGNKASEAASPKNYMSSYCQSRAGNFSLLQASKMNGIKDAASKRRLNNDSIVKQSIGTYRCIQKDGESWMVSIEPVSERKRSNSGDVRVVGLLTKLTNQKEINSANHQVEKPNSKEVEKPVIAKVTPKTEAKAPAKVETKTEVEVAKPVEKAVESSQQLQQRLYMSARRDLNAGKNQLAACNQLERAHDLGRFYNSSGPNIHTESGVLVARCLIQVPAYSKKFANPKGRAKTMLEGIVKTQNHAVAKHLLQQIK